MINKGKFSLLIVGKNIQIDQRYLDLFEDIFLYSLKEQVDEDSQKYDMVLDLENLELYHGFNKKNIINFEDIDGINVITTDEILSKIKEIDFDIPLAIEMLGGSVKVFNNVLFNYLNEYGNFEEMVNDFLSKEDYDSIRKLIHKIKGVSLYLGSEKLLAFATNIEYKIYNNLSSKDDILNFISYHNRMLEYVKEQVENV